MQQQLEQAKQRREALAQEIEDLGRDEGSINRALVEAANRGQELEAQVDRAERELSALERTHAQLNKSLAGQRQTLAKVLGALQRMGRKPPPALLVHPDDALSSVRGAILMGSVVPPLQAKASVLATQLETLARTTRQIAEQKRTVTASLNALGEDEQRLNALLARKQELSGKTTAELEAEQVRATELAAKAKSLAGLIGSLESQIDSAADAAEQARAADEARQRAENDRLAAARAKLKDGLDVAALRPRAIDPDAKLPVLTADPTRKTPAIPFSKAAGQVLRPVAGPTLLRFGDRLPSGTSARNIAITTRPNARVRAPADSWVVYSGPFRSYGQLLILNAGETYHLIIAGLAQTNVRTGQFVLAGEPVGRMGMTANPGLAQLTGRVNDSSAASQDPVVTVELRRDGTPIDPAPWLVKERSQQTIGTIGQSDQQAAPEDTRNDS